MKRQNPAKLKFGVPKVYPERYLGAHCENLSVLSVFSVLSVRTPVYFKKCQLKSWLSQVYRAVAKRKSAYAAMLPSGTLPMKRQNHAKLKFGVPRVYPERYLDAHCENLSVLSVFSVLSVLSVLSVRTPVYFKTSQLKSWRSQKFCRTEVRRSQGLPRETGRLEVGPTKRRGAYAGMTIWTKNRAIDSGLVS